MGTEAIRKRAATAASALCLAASAVAQDQPVVVEGPVSEAIYVNERHKEGNDQYGFAGAHRAGDMLYVSGVVVGSRQGEVLDDAAFREAVRNAFHTIGRVLEASGADYANVVDLITFHVWDSQLYAGNKQDQLQAIVDVKREFMDEPDPAWTAVGTTELVPDNGIIEIRATAYAPRDDS